MDLSTHRCVRVCGIQVSQGQLQVPMARVGHNRQHQPPFVKGDRQPQRFSNVKHSATSGPWRKGRWCALVRPSVRNNAFALQVLRNSSPELFSGTIIRSSSPGLPARFPELVPEHLPGTARRFPRSQFWNGSPELSGRFPGTGSGTVPRNCRPGSPDKRTQVCFVKSLLCWEPFFDGREKLCNKRVSDKILTLCC